jgi:Protein of unknown function (DUF4254)
VSAGGTFRPLDQGSPSGGVLPTVAEVVADLRSATDDRARPRPDGLLGLLRDLHDTNLEQWGLEDRSRECNGDDTAVAEAKRGIDELNARRHGVVEAIDAAITDAVTQQPSATPATESPGMAFDRLSVLIIRTHHTEVAARDGRGARGLEARLPLLRTQVRVLEEAIEDLLAEVRAGTRRFLPHQSLKLYGR